MRFDQMKDIKSLYNAAKISGKHSDIMSYTEAVKELLENHPNEFISNLEYIINSDIGLTRLDDFVEKYGMSVALYDDLMACLESCKKKCEERKLNTSMYDEYIEKYEMFRKDHQNCFCMFESFTDNDYNDYVNTYYSFNGKGVQNSRLLVGMIDKFNEAAIPDLLITASHYGDTVLSSTLKYLYKKESFNNPVMFQWISECVHEINPSFNCDMLDKMVEGSMESIVNAIKDRDLQILRESVLTGDNNAVYEYTEDELHVIQDLISYKEYKLTCIENTDEIMKLQNEIYSLYEIFDGIIDEPESKDIEFKEVSWISNTRNKKTGEAPGYLRNNHDLGWGETDNPSTSSDDENKGSDGWDEDNDTKTADDYRRPSAGGTQSSDGNWDDDSSSNNSTSAAQNPSTTNYYYYTYHDSFNKNTHSFNKDSSSHDNHSRHDNSVTNDSSVHNSTRKIVDDHSSNKRYRADDYNGYQYDDEVESESSKPWKLSMNFGPSAYNEEVGDADDLKPESDHPIKDMLQDIDKKAAQTNQKIKRGVQNAQNVARAAVKPVQRAGSWIQNTIYDWKDADENKVKEKMADPHARKNIFNAISTAIKTGSLAKAGILLNPVFLFLAITKKKNAKKNEFRIRNEMIGELKTEIKIIDEKIKDAGYHDKNAKYKLMRLRNEMEKKLVRVGGGPGIRKSI